jgi:hypothetical protein
MSLPPTLVAYVNARLASASRQVFTGSSLTSPGTAGTVPAPQAGPNVKILTSDGEWTNVNITHLHVQSFTQWQSSTMYDTPDLFLTDSGRLLRVLVPHLSTQIDADLAAGKLLEMGGADEFGAPWATGTVFREGQGVVYNGQLVQATVTHISTTFAADCVAGRWRFISNSSFTTTPTGTNNYSFVGHTVVRDNRLWTCIVPHTTSTWVQANWLSLQRDYVGATALVAGQAGLMPAAPAGAHNYALFGDGTYKDIFSELAQGGPSAAVAAALDTLTANLNTTNGNVTAINTALTALSATVANINRTNAGGVSPNPITTSQTITTALLGLFIPVNTTGGSVTLTMPASPNAGDTYTLVDAAGSWSTNPVTISSLLIRGVQDGVILDVAGAVVAFKYLSSGAGWVILSD